MIMSKSGNKNFIQKIIDTDNQTGKWDCRVHTRFPPEPNGYLHIGHAKSICLNFSIAKENNGLCNLRFDDTNPVKEEQEFVNSIIDDVRWLGFDWGERMYFASDYFDQMYDLATQLIKNNKAFVCDQTLTEIRDNRGTLTEKGKESPFRNRSISENINLFQRMKSGEFKNGEKTLRAKIDMAHTNLNMRDPVIYRILHSSHHRTGDKWCIYPMYDWAHGIEDSIEKITHSICTLEFEDHRPLYDWYLEQLDIYHPQQIEFARLNINFTVLSKRKLKQLVDEGHVDGWDDPRMPTISGLRRRGYTPSSIRNFANEVGVTKRDSIIDIVRLENSLRAELNKSCNRVFGVLNPLKVVITNYPEDVTETLKAINNPEDPNAGNRDLPFSRTLYIERDDFMENPPKKFFRLRPGGEVRLKYAYFIRCHDVIKDDDDNIIEIHCKYDPKTLGGIAPDGRKVKSTIHWVSAEHSVNGEVHLYDRLFVRSDPEGNNNFLEALNPNSLRVINCAKLEPLLSDPKNEIFQFERLGYFKRDSKISNDHKNIFIRVVTLRDSWARYLKENIK